MELHPNPNTPAFLNPEGPLSGYRPDPADVDESFGTMLESVGSPESHIEAVQNLNEEFEELLNLREQYREKGEEFPDELANRAHSIAVFFLDLGHLHSKSEKPSQ